MYLTRLSFQRLRAVLGLFFLLNAYLASLMILLLFILFFLFIFLFIHSWLLLLVIQSLMYVLYSSTLQFSMLSSFFVLSNFDFLQSYLLQLLRFHNNCILFTVLVLISLVFRSYIIILLDLYTLIYSLLFSHSWRYL